MAIKDEFGNIISYLDGETANRPTFTGSYVDAKRRGCMTPKEIAEAEAYRQRYLIQNNLED